MKNSWIYCVTISLLLAIVWAASATEATAKKRKARSPEELTNFQLSPEYSQWLLGAISRLATQEEIDTYLALSDDTEASSFIEQFWAKRGPEAVWPTKGKRQLFDERSAEADRLYAEGTHRGRHTDRGTVYVLYGPPDETRFEQARQARSATVEVWEYAPEAGEGLDQQRPRSVYMFIKQGDVTVEYRGAIRGRIETSIPPGEFH